MGIYRTSPEKKIETEIRGFLAARGWLVQKTHSSAYSAGWPDLMCFHRDYGLRWVDVKNPKRYSYTKAQCKTWPVWESYGLGVWIMFEASESEYAKLFEAPNFREFWKPRYEEHLETTEDIINRHYSSHFEI